MGQFRRGYFESFDGEVGLAMDDAIRPVFPAFLLTEHDELGVPPGVSAIAPLVPGAVYELAKDSTLAPYVVIGGETPLPPPASQRQASSGEGRMVGPRTLALQDGRLALVAWDGTRPWREDAARLSALHDACAPPDAAPALSVAVTEGQLEIRLGRCSLAEPLPSGVTSPTLLGALAGPEWVRVARRPGWAAQRWFVWPVLAAVVVKVAATWWGLGLPSTVASSSALAVAAVWWPVPAMLTWPVTFAVGLLAAIVRAGLLVLRKLPPRLRAPAALTGLALVAYVVVSHATQPRSFPPILHAHLDRGQPDACAIIGYSTAGGASLRRNFGGLRVFLDQGCERCRDATASLAAGGEVMDWARDAYCAGPASFGAGGQVVFWGAANDDFLWGVLSVARLFIIGQQTIDQWQRNQPAAITASLARIDDQASAIHDVVQCANSRHARFLYLHDFLVTDLVAGRDPDRAAMLARRRTAVEGAGGMFIDLYTRFADEAGIAWFNDYLHPSLIVHERVADLVCRQFS